MAGTNEIQVAPLLPSQKISEKKPVSGKQRKKRQNNKFKMTERLNEFYTQNVITLQDAQCSFYEHFLVANN